MGTSIYISGPIAAVCTVKSENAPLCIEVGTKVFGSGTALTTDIVMSFADPILSRRLCEAMNAVIAARREELAARKQAADMIAAADVLVPEPVE